MIIQHALDILLLALGCAVLTAAESLVAFARSLFAQLRVAHGS